MTGACSSFSSQVDADEPKENKEDSSNTLAVALGVTLSIVAIVCAAIAAYCYVKRKGSYEPKGTYTAIPLTSGLRANKPDSTSPEDPMLRNVDIASSAQRGPNIEEPPEVVTPDEPLGEGVPGEPAVAFSDEHVKLKRDEHAEGPV